MSVDYIRRTYGVPARRGAKVLYTPNPEFPPQSGVIVSARNGHLRVRMDQPSLRGRVLTYKLHPTWRLEYLKTPNVKDEAQARRDGRPRSAG